jgi:hypothetical protein
MSTESEGQPSDHAQRPVDLDDEAWHRAQAVQANNSTWELLDGRPLVGAEVDELLHRAYAAAYHWNRAAGRTLTNTARASWLVARCHTVAGHPVPALHHAERCAELTEEAGLADFDLAYRHEAMARALALAGRLDEAAAEHRLAAAVPIERPEDREVFEADLATGPWFGLDP